MEFGSTKTSESDFHWSTQREFGAESPDDLRACLKAELVPGEVLLWAARACPPPVPTINAFPAFFTALLCGLSGYALAVVFGVYGLVALPAREASLVFGLCPAAIGFFIILALVGRRIQYLRTRWRLARTFYGLTNWRAIVGLDFKDGEPIWFESLPLDKIHDTVCIEHQDGTGDVYFVGDEFVTDPDGYEQTLTTVVSPELGFVGAPRAREIAEMVRRILIRNRRQPRWNIG
jgi:hypothetical protein